jgi:hypothetical protein
MSTTHTTSSTFTRTDARYITSKVAADLRWFQIFYDHPTDAEIDDYIVELTELLTGRYLDYVEYGFRHNNAWVLSARYTARWDGGMDADDRPGRIPVGADIGAASWGSYLVMNGNWDALSATAKQRIEDSIPVKRSGSAVPGYGTGAWVEDCTYGRNGVSVARKVFQPR